LYTKRRLIPTMAATSAIAIRSATSTIIRPRRASPTYMVVAQKTSPSGEYAPFCCTRSVALLARGSKIRAKLLMTPPQGVRRTLKRGAKLFPRAGHGAQCVSGIAVTDGAERGRRGMLHHQGRTLPMRHRDLFLYLFSQKERPLRHILSRNERGRAATRASTVPCRVPPKATGGTSGREGARSM
jgi:hypothetical protein